MYQVPEVGCLQLDLFFIHLLLPLFSHEKDERKLLDKLLKGMISCKGK